MAGTRAVSTAPIVPQLRSPQPCAVLIVAGVMACGFPNKIPATTISRIVPIFNEVRSTWIAPKTHTEIIDRGRGNHHDRRKWLGSGEREFITTYVACEQRSGDHRKQKSEEAQESRGQSSHRHGALEKGAHPAEKKSPEGAEAAVEVDVGTASFGESRAKFCVAEGAE